MRLPSAWLPTVAEAARGIESRPAGGAGPPARRRIDVEARHHRFIWQLAAGQRRAQVARSTSASGQQAGAPRTKAALVVAIGRRRRAAACGGTGAGAHSSSTVLAQRV